MSSVSPRRDWRLGARQLTAACTVLVTAICGVGCGPTADAPLSVPLGLPRDQATAELRQRDFCPRDVVAAATAVYPRCRRPGADWADVWVVADFEHDRLIRLRRWERFTDDSRAVERWNELVEKRVAAGEAPSDAARRALRQRQELPAGTRSWTAFRSGEHTLVAVYLLTPSPPENASVMEELVAATGAAP
jgi:hypothetical protein